MIEINRNPSRRELLTFGGLFPLFFAIVGGLVWWRFDARMAAIFIWCIAGAITLAFFAIPAVRRPLYLGWMYAFFPLGWVVSHVILALVYFLVFTPTGLIMRMLGRDPMQRTLDREKASYWEAHDPPPPAERYFRQF